MKRVLLAAAAIAGLCAGPRAATAQEQPFLGQIMIFAGNFCPTGWLETNGQLLAISQNTALFSILGTTYGGNGTSTFALPHMQPIYTQTRATFTTCIAVEGVYPSRS
jgi:microcystin-dependent protein